MKKIVVLTVSMLLFGNAIHSQVIETSNVPPAVISAFNTAFLSPEAVKWEMDYDHYVAKFEKNKVEIFATYNKDGGWIKTETPVTHKSLPAAVKSALTKQFNIYKENAVEKIEKPEGVTYQIDLEYNQQNYEVEISENGEVLRKDEVKEYKKN